MSLQVYTYDELEKQNAFMQADIERVNAKALKLKELLTEYIKNKKEEFQDIQDSLHSISNRLVFSDDDLKFLLNVQSSIDKLSKEMQEKQ